jgi:hypothetical protein
VNRRELALDAGVLCIVAGVAAFDWRYAVILVVVIFSGAAYLGQVNARNSTRNR